MTTVAHATLAVLTVTLATQASADDRPKFEVASIKANTGGESRRGARVLPGGRIEITNMTLRQMIRIAYGSTVIQSDDQVTGGDAWIGTERFDVPAKAEGDPGFDSATVRARVGQQRRTAGSGRETVSGLSAESVIAGIRNAGGSLNATSVTMAQVAQLFAGYPSVVRPVIDRTGLTGKYDWHLEWTPTFLNSPTGDGQFVANPAAESGPNFFTALSEQARLKLQPERAPVDVIVIDRAERPAEE